MSERLTKKTSTLTDQLKDIAERRRQQAEDKFTSGGGPSAHEASDRWLMAVTAWKLSEIADALAGLSGGTETASEGVSVTAPLAILAALLRSIEGGERG